MDDVSPLSPCFTQDSSSGDHVESVPDDPINSDVRSVIITFMSSVSASLFCFSSSSSLDEESVSSASVDCVELSELTI